MADVNFVVEPRHRARLQAQFARAIRHKSLHLLDIPEDYDYIDPELIHLFEQSGPGLLR